jgi:hypothetical protein
MKGVVMGEVETAMARTGRRKILRGERIAACRAAVSYFVYLMSLNLPVRLSNLLSVTAP